MPLCEMCGKESRLISAEIEGGELRVCSGCAKYGVINKPGQTGHVRSQFSNKRKRTNKSNAPELKVADNYAQSIRSIRESKSLNQEEFANLINEKESILAKWESGSLKPRLDIAKRLERVLGIKLIVKEEPGEVKIEKKKFRSEEFTLGDFVKVRKRK